MKTLKEIEEDFKSEFFTTAAAMGTYGVDELGNAPIIKSKYYRTPSAMTFFYRQAIAEILGEVAGKGNMNSEERIKQCGEYAKGDENLDCAIGFDDGFDAGYFQAKAEIRERIKSILE